MHIEMPNIELIAAPGIVPSHGYKTRRCDGDRPEKVNIVILITTDIITIIIIFIIISSLTFTYYILSLFKYRHLDKLVDPIIQCN